MKRKAILICGALLVPTVLYLVFAFSPLPSISRLRQIYIETAMSTMNHQWLADKLLPKSVVEAAVTQQRQRNLAQTGLRSLWPEKPMQPALPITDEKSFFAVFDQLDSSQTVRWLQTKPELPQYDWQNLRCFDTDGLGLQTKQGDPVIGIDAPNGILLIAVQADAASGVLAICEYPAGLSIASAAHPGQAGQPAGEIGQDSNAVLAMTCSAFHNANDGGNGAELAGYAMCVGTPYGATHLPAGNKRVELWDDDLLRICDSTDAVGSRCTDAAEFRPALIVDGTMTVTDDWAGLQPRVCLGQTRNGEILMLAMEGRIPSKGVLGVTLTACARLLLRYEGYQAINLDGGNSAMLWYDRQYLIQCSDPDYPEGRPLPNAVVYGIS